MVGMTRFERATPSSQAKCATKLRYIPIYTVLFNCQIYEKSEVLPLGKSSTVRIFLGRVKLRYIPRGKYYV